MAQRMECLREKPSGVDGSVLKESVLVQEPRFQFWQAGPFMSFNHNATVFVEMERLQSA